MNKEREVLKKQCYPRLRAVSYYQRQIRLWKTFAWTALVVGFILAIALNVAWRDFVRVQTIADKCHRDAMELEQLQGARIEQLQKELVRLTHKEVD